MLQLKHNGEPIKLVIEGDWLSLPDGRRVSPAEAGWASGDGYELSAYIAPTPEPPTFQELKELKVGALAERRWQAVTGGVNFAGAVIRTDPDSRSNITGAVALFDNDPTLTVIDFEAQPGVWIALDKTTMTAVGIAVGRHMQACFSHARVLSVLIDAAEDGPMLDAIDIDEGWPT